MSARKRLSAKLGRMRDLMKAGEPVYPHEIFTEADMAALVKIVQAYKTRGERRRRAPRPVP